MAGHGGGGGQGGGGEEGGVSGLCSSENGTTSKIPSQHWALLQTEEAEWSKETQGFPQALCLPQTQGPAGGAALGAPSRALLPSNDLLLGEAPSTYLPP